MDFDILYFTLCALYVDRLVVYSYAGRRRLPSFILMQWNVFSTLFSAWGRWDSGWAGGFVVGMLDELIGLCGHLNGNLYLVLFFVLKGDGGRV